MRNIYVFLFAVLLLSLAGCGEQSATTNDMSDDGMTTYTIGSVQALTGEGSVYGVPVQRVIEQAVEDINAEWAAENKKLEVIFEDGKCNGKDALTAAQNLVNVQGVKIIYGATCSGEALGMASFLEQNQVVLFSPTASSPEVTYAGDYVFRNYPSDTAQVAAMVPFIASKGYKRIALLTENTDYAQGLRNAYLEQLPSIGVEVVADEVAVPNTKDVRTEVAKIKSANPDAVILLPQTIPTATIFAKQLYEANVEAQRLGNDILTLGEPGQPFPTELEGFYSPSSVFEKEDSEEFTTLQEQTQCELGFYCASTYDGVILLKEILELCGDQDADCVKNALYATQDWEGMLSGTTSFDANGDVAGSFQISELQNGEWIKVA